MPDTLRALIVEDSEDDTFLLLRELQKGGYLTEHLRVENAQQMTSALADRQWDVIFSDYSVPGFNSHRAFSLLKESGQDIPFIIVSGTIGEDAAVNAMKAGVNDYFVKGHLGRLAPALQRELREAAERRGRRVAEASVGEYQERLALLALATNDALWEWNADSRSMWWHESLPRMFGYPSETRPSFHFWKTRIHPDDRKGVIQSLFTVLRSGGRTWSREYRFQRGNGDYANVFGRGTVVRDPAGKPRRVVGALLDITEKRRMEEQLRQAQKIEAVGRLAGGVAHDFNNLLTAVLGYTEELRRDLAAGTRAADSLKEIEKCVERGAALTRQLLAFSRKQVVRPRVIDLNVVVQDMGRMLRRMVGEDVELVIRLAPRLGAVRADPGHIEQVLMNLAVNSRDAMPGGGTLTIETGDVELTKEDALHRPEILPGPYVELRVADSGQGMDDATREHLFEPFFTTKGPEHGTGLGLATVYGIVKQHQGYVYADSRPTQGAVFRVYLPRLSAEDAREAEIRAPAAGVPQSTAPARGSETILLVDDNDSVRDFAQRFLERQGYRVLAATRPSEALEIADKEPTIHLLIADLRMPQMGGQELADRIILLRPDLRALFISGFAEPGELAEAGRRGAFLPKPFTGHELLLAVRETLDQAAVISSGAPPASAAPAV